MRHKIYNIQIDSEVVPLLLSWINQKPPPFVSYDTTHNTFWEGGICILWKVIWFFFMVFLARGKMAYVLIFINMSGLQWRIDLWCSSQDPQCISVSLPPSPLGHTKLSFFYQFSVGVPKIWLHKRVISIHRICYNHTPDYHQEAC